MKYIKAFKKKTEPNISINTRVMSREKSEELFDYIVNTFDSSKLDKKGSGFMYDDMMINKKSVEIDNIFYTLPIDIQDGIFDFLETI